MEWERADFGQGSGMPYTVQSLCQRATAWEDGGDWKWLVRERDGLPGSSGRAPDRAAAQAAAEAVMAAPMV